MKSTSRRTTRVAGKVFVVSSPSGGGKTTIVRAILRRVPKLARSISVTTRPRRPEERARVDYRFVAEPQFAALREQGGLLEWAQVHQAYYGTPRRWVEQRIASGWDVILSIDVQGAQQVRKHLGKRSVLVFLLPPSMRDLRNRLINRRTDSADSIRHRLQAAKRELACARWYDYQLVNRDLDRAVDELEAIITAERLRVQSDNGGEQ